MSKNKLGKVSVCPRGAYDETATYEPLDIVSYNGGSYIAKTESSGIAPSDSEAWQGLTEQGEYEKVEAVSITEDTAEFVRTAEPDGTPYKFTSALVSVVFPSAESRTIHAGFGGSGLVRATGASAFFGNLRCVIRPLYGVWDLFCYYGESGVSAMTGASAIRWMSTLKDFAHVGYIKVYGSTIPAGTIITIYAVRA